MSFKKHISLFVVFFISCSTSICDQDGQQTAYRQSVGKTGQFRPLLAQLKTPHRSVGCYPGSDLRKPSGLLP